MNQKGTASLRLLKIDALVLVGKPIALGGATTVNRILLAGTSLVALALTVTAPGATFHTTAVALSGVDGTIIVIRVRRVLTSVTALLVAPNAAHDLPAGSLRLDRRAADAHLIDVLEQTGRRVVASRLALNLTAGRRNDRSARRIGRGLNRHSRRHVRWGISRGLRGHVRRRLSGRKGRFGAIRGRASRLVETDSQTLRPLAAL